MVEPAPLYRDTPKGFRFCPTDEELVGHFLRHKLMADDPSIHHKIPEIDVCNYQPWQLPELSLIKSDYPEWFFFSPREYKHPNGNRSNRSTSLGYWKVTGKDRKIRDRVTNDEIGTKKTLVFYEGRAPGVKTNWIIHEYHALFPPKQRTFVLCKLRKKHDKKKTKGKYDESESNNNMAFEYENQANSRMGSDVQMSLTPSESNEFVGSSVAPEESEEFDFKSFLRSSPSEDEQY